jgi:hypothetical protein
MLDVRSPASRTKLLILLSPLLLTACHKNAPPETSPPSNPNQAQAPVPGAGMPVPGGAPAPAAPTATSGPTPGAGEIVVDGSVTKVDPARKTIQMSVNAIVLPPDERIALSSARKKTVLVSGTTTIHVGTGSGSIQDLKSGQAISVVGKDLGKGKRLPARLIVLPGASAPASISAPNPGVGAALGGGYPAAGSPPPAGGSAAATYPAAPVKGPN